MAITAHLGSCNASSANQDNSKQGLLSAENVPGCTTRLSRMTQQVAGVSPTDSTTRRLSFSDLYSANPSRDTGDCQRRKSLRPYGRQTIIKPTQDTSSTFNELNGNHEKRHSQSIYVRSPTTANLKITETSSSDCDVPDEVLPVIALVPLTPCGSVDSPAPPPDSPITIQKFVAARANVSLRRRSSLMCSAPPLMVASCPVCSRPERFLSEDDLSCRRCRKQWLACQLWYQACDGGRMERLRVPFVRPGESNAVNRALSESLGLLPPTASEREPFKRMVRPRRVLGLRLSVLVKYFRGWVGRKGQTTGST